jgi:GNAT superfamily N-acetyltransferase
VDVIPVESPQELARFIRYPYDLYRDDPLWVAPLPSDERTRLTSGKNPYFQHGEAACFLAREGGKDRGRVSASVDRNHDSFHGERQATFGFFEAASPDAAAALLAAAERWARAKGAEVLRGPMSFTTNDECGLLVEGFDLRPAIMMPYNPPHYAGWVEAAGLTKAKDLYSFQVPVPRETPKLLARIAAKVRRLHRVTLRTIDMKRFDEELARIKDVYNAAWDRNWGFVPMTDAEIDHMAKQLRPAVVARLIQFAEIDGATVGVSLIIPDVNVALAPLKGRLFPFGIVRLLWSLPRIREIRLMALGVKSDYRRRGIESLLIDGMVRETSALGYVTCDVGWTLEDNDGVNRLIEEMGGRRYKVHRIYERRLERTGAS